MSLFIVPYPQLIGLRGLSQLDAEVKGLIKILFPFNHMNDDDLSSILEQPDARTRK